MLLRGAFTVLFLLSGASSVIVPAPTNVTVSCQNVKTTVSWIYNKQQPDTTFKVTIQPEDSQPHVVYTREHSYELGSFVWQSQKLYMSFLYVTITAIQGGNQSEAVKSNSFSFNNLKTVHTKCFLDFPHVNLLMHEMKMSVTFQNPLSFYKELNSTVEGTSSEFTFDVILDEHKFSGKCFVKDSYCKLDVKFSEGEDKCVSLTGHLLYNNGINFVSFRKTHRFCSTEPPEHDHGVNYLAVLLMSSFVLLICVMIILICKVKAWTTKTPDPPKILEWTVQANHTNVHYTVTAVMSPVSMYKPYKTSVIKTEVKCYPESYHMSSSGSNSVPSDTHLYKETRRQLQDGNQELEALGLISGENRTDNDSADVQIECISVSSQEEERGSISPYDSPHFVLLDMGDGDMVTGYSEKKRVF
ncbi:interferon gamma receptor 1 precursor [Austrofundulus limnaeus]|uniref:Interferon gamma receptor 1 precursor n=1 Tax=Austrofundulus limnaeus TaxID=52670 RepID=A0AC36JRU2_AUSLI|nr:interferon gamma receptor 1 precursor [Austrofundulus limnaeus]